MDYQLIISGTIGWWNGCSADYVRYVLSQNKDKDVHVGFCSLGGFVKDGLEIHQAFRDHGKVHAHAFGMNASISTIAMLGCKTIDIVKGSFFLIHNVSVLIDKYEQSNKEQIDDYISKLKLQRDSLNTFDDVLATMYSEKTGKTVDECRKQMKNGNWMTAQQAVDFGLVDSIREDEASQQAAAQFQNDYVNLYSFNYKDAGLPPLPVENQDQSQLAHDLDGEGNPTQSLLQKTWQGLQSLLRNQHAAHNFQTNMIKVFKTVMNLLAITDGFSPDDNGNISLTQDQMKTIEDRLAELEKDDVENKKAIKDSADAVIKLKEKLKNALEESKQKDEQIANLKGSAADETDEPEKNEGKEAIDANKLYNLIKDV